MSAPMYVSPLSLPPPPLGSNSLPTPPPRPADAHLRQIDHFGSDAASSASGGNTVSLVPRSCLPSDQSLGNVDSGQSLPASANVSLIPRRTSPPVAIGAAPSGGQCLSTPHAPGDSLQWGQRLAPASAIGRAPPPISRGRPHDSAASSYAPGSREDRSRTPKTTNHTSYGGSSSSAAPAAGSSDWCKTDHGWDRDSAFLLQGNRIVRNDSYPCVLESDTVVKRRQETCSQDP